MARLRIAGIEAGDGPALPRLRIAGIEASGDAATIPRLRIAGIEASGTSQPSVGPVTPQTVEPLTIVTVTAAPAVGSVIPDSWIWRKVSGPTIGLEPSGATATFTAPAAMPPAGTEVKVGVRAVTAGVQSFEQTVIITVLPCLIWSWTGAAYVGMKALPFA